MLEISNTCIFLVHGSLSPAHPNFRIGVAYLALGIVSLCFDFQPHSLGRPIDALTRVFAIMAISKKGTVPGTVCYKTTKIDNIYATNFYQIQSVQL